MDIRLIIIQIVAVLFAVTIHEAAHAYAAFRCGDKTAAMLGRMTINPFKHIDPVGSVILPLILAISHAPIIGWAKPVPVNPRKFRNFKRDDMIVSLAGVGANFCAMVGAAMLARVWYTVGPMMGSTLGSLIWEPMFVLLYYSVVINFILMVFNLLPIPPLDGSHIFANLLPARYSMQYRRLQPVLIIGLLLLVFSGIWGKVVGPVLKVVVTLLMGPAVGA